jgi:hypothetical protein
VSFNFHFDVDRLLQGNLDALFQELVVAVIGLRDGDPEPELGIRICVDSLEVVQNQFCPMWLQVQVVNNDPVSVEHRCLDLLVEGHLGALTAQNLHELRPQMQCAEEIL